MASSIRRDLVVIGGGISGLTTAFWQQEAGRAVTLLEASSRLGGAITTHREGDFLFELGPNTVLDGDPSVGALIDALGLTARKLGARPSASRRWLWRKNRLIALPSSPFSALTTRLISLSAKLRVLREPWIPRREAGNDESIADFVRRRLGPELLDYAVGPFVSGVYAGDPERLAVRWATPKLAALEAEHGSLIRGAWARRRGPIPGGGMFSFREGLAELPNRLGERIGDLRTGVEAQHIERAAGGFSIATSAGSIEATKVVLAVPADVAARLLDGLSDGASRVFEQLPYAPVVVVALGVRRSDVAHPLGGFGFLAPRKESLRMLGCLFPSEIFTDRAPDGQVALSAIVGGRTDEEITTWDDERIIALVREELHRAIGLTGEPIAAVVRRWRRAIPQYEIGHGRFIELARALETRLPGLHIGGNLLGGVSVADCIKNGTALGHRI